MWQAGRQSGWWVVCLGRESATSRVCDCNDCCCAGDTLSYASLHLQPLDTGKQHTVHLPNRPKSVTLTAYCCCPQKRNITTYSLTSREHAKDLGCVLHHPLLINVYAAAAACLALVALVAASLGRASRRTQLQAHRRDPILQLSHLHESVWCWGEGEAVRGQRALAYGNSLVVRLVLMGPLAWVGVGATCRISTLPPVALPMRTPTCSAGQEIECNWGSTAPSRHQTSDITPPQACVYQCRSYSRPAPPRLAGPPPCYGCADQRLAVCSMHLLVVKVLSHRPKTAGNSSSNYWRQSPRHSCALF